jgi:hypothetical protein
MSRGLKVFLGIIGTIIIIIVLFLGYLGFIPGVSAIFGSNKPRDLGVKYTAADLASARAKSQIEYEVLPANTPLEQSLIRTGSRPIDATFTSAEITSLMNDRPFKYWPYKNVQMKFNADGSAEVSGQLIKDRLPGYCASIGVSKTVADKVIKYLPANTIFYVKGKASLSDNKVSLLDPSKVEIGRLSIPINTILSFDTNMTNSAYAADSSGIESELSSVSGKKAKIIAYINEHLAGIQGFFAKSAFFTDNELHFNGNLNEKEATVR